MKNKTIIYIIGDGRSGSTILEEYIAQELGGIKIGEARRFWFRYYESKTLCECGTAIHKCEFWRNVEKDLSHNFKNELIHNKINESIVFKKNRDFIFNNKKNDFLIDLQNEFYHAISKNSNENLIIDSSKIYSWGIHLDNYTDNNILYLHLVRDVGSVANSWKKDIILPEYIDEKVSMPRRNLFEHLKTWFVINLTILRYFKNKSNYIYVDYQSFCQNPNKLIDQIKSNQIFENFNFEPNNSSPHGIGGNPVRKGSSGNLKIKYNESKNLLTFYERFLYSISSFIYNIFKSRYV